MPASRRRSAASRVLARSALPRWWAQPSSTPRSDRRDRLDDRSELRVDLVLAALPRARTPRVAPVLRDDEQPLEQVEVVVAGVEQRLAEGGEVVQGSEQRVGGIDAVLRQRGERVELVVHLAGEVGEGRRLGALLGHELLHEVPRSVEGQRQRSQLGGIDLGGVEEQDRALERRVLEQLVEDAGPAPVEGHRRGHLVEHLDLRWQPRLDGVLGEDALREGVQRADGGAVELGQCQPAALRLGAVARRPPPAACAGRGRAARRRPSR